MPRLVHQGLGGRPEGVAPHQPPQLAQLRREVKGRVGVEVAEAVGQQPLHPLNPPQLVGQQALHQPQRHRPREQAHPLLAVGVQHVVDPRLPLHRAGFAVSHGCARQRLQLQRDVFGHVPQPGAVPQAAEKAPRLAQGAAVPLQRGQQFHQAVVEAGQFVRRIVLQRAQIELKADHGLVAVDVGAAVDLFFQHSHGGQESGRARRLA